MEIDRFSVISSIRPEAPATWERRIFLTFDLDWAHDRVIEHTVDLVETAGVPATWFVTHETPLIERLRANPSFELGIHPNFLPLLMQRDRVKGDDAAEVLDRLLAVVPEAKSVRSHSLVQSGRLLKLFRDRGLTHDVNAFIPEQSGMTLRPWIDWFGMVRAPYGWEDDFWCATGCTSDMQTLLARDGINGFDFHPIHVFLNSESLARYEAARPFFQSPDRLASARFDGAGTCTILQDLLALTR